MIPDAVLPVVSPPHRERRCSVSGQRDARRLGGLSRAGPTIPPSPSLPPPGPSACRCRGCGASGRATSRPCHRWLGSPRWGWSGHGVLITIGYAQGDGQGIELNGLLTPLSGAGAW